MAARTEKKVTARQSSLRAAFSLLDGTQRGWVPPVTMSALFQAMDHLRASEAAETRNESPSASPRLGWLKWVVSWLQLTLEPRLSLDLRRHATELFLALDRRGDFKIWADEFASFCDVIGQQTKQWPPRAAAPSGSRPRLAAGGPRPMRQLCRLLVTHPWFDAGVYLVLALALAVIAVESALDGLFRIVFVHVELGIGWLWLLELLVKLVAYGWRPYWEQTLHKFDCVATAIVGTVETLVLLGVVGLHDPAPIRYALLLRTLRLAALSSKIPRWRVLTQSIAALVPVVLPILGLQLSICSLFSVAGVHLFGGLIRAENPALRGTEYEDEGYQVFNYNDFGLAMVTSFNLCVVNNWFVIMDGIVAASQTGWSRAFFVLFYVIAVVFVLNLVIAFTLEAFLNEISLQAASPPGDGGHIRLPTVGSSASVRSLQDIDFSLPVKNVPVSSPQASSCESSHIESSHIQRSASER